ncbi:MAG: hypothetical protein ACREFD_04245 [Stellaceae bacterium]
MSAAAARTGVEDALRRIDELVQELTSGQDSRTRELARELLQVAIDLHGLALAKIAVRLSASDDGRALYAELGRDEQVKAVLLLHGLHPESAEARIDAVLTALRPRFPDIDVRLVSVSDGIARIAVDPGPRHWDSLCQELGGTLLDAAPDLDDIAIDRTGVGAPVLAVAVA